MTASALDSNHVCTLSVTDVDGEWLTHIQTRDHARHVATGMTAGEALDLGIKWADERGLHVMLTMIFDVLRLPPAEYARQRDQELRALRDRSRSQESQQTER